MRITRMLAVMTGAVVAIATFAATALATSSEQAGGHAAHATAQHMTGAHGAHEAELHDDLAQVRRATARFHDVDAAIAAGYQLGWVNGAGALIIDRCIAHPTAGAMGYHYFNDDLMDDLAADALAPEVLVYAKGSDGELRLVAVEWVVRGPLSNPVGLSVDDPVPSVLGMPMHILNPAVGFYLMHAWIWQPNPTGMFTDWNPEVTCP